MGKFFRGQRFGRWRIIDIIHRTSPKLHYWLISDDGQYASVPCDKIEEFKAD